jgi:hypothetical protein
MAYGEQIFAQSVNYPINTSQNALKYSDEFYAAHGPVDVLVSNPSIESDIEIIPQHKHIVDGVTTWIDERATAVTIPKGTEAGSPGSGTFNIARPWAGAERKMRFQFKNTTAIANTVGVLQVETAAVVAAGGITAGGYASVVVTAAGMTGSPITIPVLLETDDTADEAAAKIRTALGANANVAAFFTVTGATNAIILTAKVKAANDATANLALDNWGNTGITEAASSADTTAGVAGSAGVKQVETVTFVGNVTKSGLAKITIAGGEGAPVDVKYFAVRAGDTPKIVRDKAILCLKRFADVDAYFTFTKGTSTMIATCKTAAANDGDLALTVENHTSAGITTAASANTTGGTAPSAGTRQVETATVAGTITANGYVRMVVTAAGVTGSPITIDTWILTTDDSPTKIATKLRAALAANAAICAKYTVGGATDKLVLTNNTALPAANDDTLNIAILECTCTGITTAASSANTAAGVARTEFNLSIAVKKSYDR